MTTILRSRIIYKKPGCTLLQIYENSLLFLVADLRSPSLTCYDIQTYILHVFTLYAVTVTHHNLYMAYRNTRITSLSAEFLKNGVHLSKHPCQESSIITNFRLFTNTHTHTHTHTHLRAQICFELCTWQTASVQILKCLQKHMAPLIRSQRKIEARRWATGRFLWSSVGYWYHH